MNNWTPRSERLGTRIPDGPYHGVPEHLDGPLRAWLHSRFDAMDDEEEVATLLAVRLRVILKDSPYATSYQLVEQTTDADDLLDLVEGTLQVPIAFGLEREASASSLQRLLLAAGSAYRVSKGGLLVERVGAEAQANFAAATSVSDETTAQLLEAWAKAYGRAPDPSDAWDHSIKVIESILGPVIEPSNAKATLGSIITRLEQDAGSKFRSVFPGPLGGGSIKELASTLRLIWPNPDRHASGGSRQPSLAEARAVVNLTVSLTQCARESFLVTLR